MKKGDKVLCIKSCISKNDFINTVEELNSKGKFYIIDEINSYRVLVTCNYELSVCEYLLNDEKRYFYDYFVTEQQYRKMKLLKLEKL